MSSKFNYFPPKKTTFKQCTQIFEGFKDGRMMWFACEALKLA